MTILAHRSAWLSSALYHSGFLTLFLLDGTALLYANVPSWIPGLIAAHRSPWPSLQPYRQGQLSLSASR